MRKWILLSALSAALLVACGGGDTNPPKEEVTTGPGNLPPGNATVRTYAVTGSALYSIVLSGAGADEKKFDLPGVGLVTDLALAGNDLYAVTTSKLLKIDLNSKTFTTVGDLSNGGMNALAADRNGNLYGAAIDGTVGRLYRIDKSTARITAVGALTGFPSGDLAFNASGQLYGTVISTFGAPDQLAVIDPATARTTLIGSTEFSGVFGLEFKGGTLYGLTSSGQILTLDTVTGKGTQIRKTSLDFTGLQ